MAAAHKQSMRKRRRSSTSVEISTSTPMSPRQKMKRKLRNVICCLKTKANFEISIVMGQEAQNMGYKVENNALTNKFTFAAKYLSWTFETGFHLYLLSAMTLYMVMVAIFALLLMWTESPQNPCIQNYPYGEAFSEQFSAAFTLSWTTFSTVGYGQIGPQILKECGTVNFLTSVESLVGLLYAGLCSAILFGKVQHIYSRATVIFSHCCVIRYGEGCDEDEEDDDYDGISDDDVIDISLTESIPEETDIIQPRNLPYPFLQFRIANQKANILTGNICNVKIKASAVKATDQNQKINGRIAGPQRLFYNVHVEPNVVPLFDRLVYVRHVLNKHSPLLNAGTRRMIQQNKGRWPAAINTAEKLRSCLDLEQIIVSLEGISDISRSTVKAQYAYNPDVIKVGWRFVEMIYKSEDENQDEYNVDFDLINVIEEQSPGDGEALMKDNIFDHNETLSNAS